MKDLTDRQLLEEFLQGQSEPAFNELVRRYADLVYSIALRIVIDPHLAEDVSQRAFVALARNARKLTPVKTLGGWLHSTTHNFAVMTVRSEERRRLREQKATPVLSDSSADPVWDQIAPHLDAALSELGDSDRDILVLRYFKRRTAREIGAELGLGEQAAQKRVARALERLRAVFRSRGLVLQSMALAGVISAHAVQAVQPGLASALAAHALVNSAIPLSVAEITAKGFSIIIPMKTHPIAALVVVVACLSLGTTGFMTGKAAARKHHATVVSQLSVVASVEPATLASDRQEPPVTAEEPRLASRPDPAPVSVAEILAEAAEHFRSLDTDPDSWVRGQMALARLRPEDALNAVRQLEGYRAEATVHNGMAPAIMGLWAETDSRAAIDYTLENLTHGTLEIALQRSVQAWARRDPQAAWAWHREFSEFSDAPIASGDRNWSWPIYSEWAMRDAAGVLAHLDSLSLAEEKHAFFGISQAVKRAEYRPAILAAVSQHSHQRQKGGVAAAVAREWAQLDPQAAVEWGAALRFENAGALIRVIGDPFGNWYEADPYGASFWVETQAPVEFRGFWDRAEMLRDMELTGPELTHEQARQLRESFKLWNEAIR
jgi:RNA polymerase sigma factor (sigma-70 family)